MLNKLTYRPHYQTRSVEYMLAWMMLAQGVIMIAPGNVLIGPTSIFFTFVMPEHVWGIIAVKVGVGRLSALIINGAWHRSPLLRYAGAACGLIWWTVQGAIYWIAVTKGGLPFPNLAIYPVIVFFEAYSCFRCGQDANAQRSLSRLSRLESAAHG